MRFNPVQRIAYEWALRCFGYKHVHDHATRGLRMMEEACEFVQANDVPKELVLKVVEVVYSRPKGNRIQELGGVLLTANVAAQILAVQADDVLTEELCRVLNKPVEHFAKRNEDKVALGL